MDVVKHIEYWRRGASKALRSVPVLSREGYYSEALFWCHLSVEKALKAHVVRATGEHPPYTHDLVRLAELTGLELTDEQLRLCARLFKYQGLSRYPGRMEDEAEPEDGAELAAGAERLYAWLTSRL